MARQGDGPRTTVSLLWAGHCRPAERDLLESANKPLIPCIDRRRQIQASNANMAIKPTLCKTCKAIIATGARSIDPYTSSYGCGLAHTEALTGQGTPVVLEVVPS